MTAAEVIAEQERLLILWAAEDAARQTRNALSLAGSSLTLPKLGAILRSFDHE